MSHTIPAIFENGVFRPLQKVDLDNGEEVEVILRESVQPDPQKAAKILAEIAALPIEDNRNDFSDKLLISFRSRLL